MEAQKIKTLAYLCGTMSGKDLILATRQYAREDRAKSWRLLTITLILFLAAFAGAIVNFHWLPQMICSVLAGLLSVRLFIFYHDYLHRAILADSALAEVIFTVFGWFILAPVSIWRRSHNYHHAHNCKLYTSAIGSFPLATKQNFLEAGKQDRRIYLMMRHPLTILLGYFTVFLWGMALRSFINNPRKHMDSLLSLVFHFSVGFLVFYFFGWQGFILGFLLPFVISHAIGSYLFYAQHNFPSATHKLKGEWDYVYAALHSSSYMKMSPLMHWFTGNIGYHHIHHINPKIPFYELPRVYEEMPEFQNPGCTSLSLRDIYACLRLKAWDPESGKMIGLKQIYQ